MVREFIYIKTERGIKGNGEMIYSMEKELKRGLMVPVIRGIIKMARNAVKANFW